MHIFFTLELILLKLEKNVYSASHNFFLKEIWNWSKCSSTSFENLHFKIKNLSN